MKSILIELFASLYKNEIDLETFFRQFQIKTGLVLNENLCLEKISEAIITCDDEMLDYTIHAGFFAGFTKKSIPIMCKLLKSNCHHKHEDIAMLFRDFADPDTVDCIYTVTELKFDYLEYDDTYQFARKCIKALSKIRNENAISKLWLLSESKNSWVEGYAKKELGYKGLL